MTFDASKAFLLSLGALALASMALARRTTRGPGRFDLRWSGTTVAMAAAVAALAAAAGRGPDPWAAGRLLALLLAAAALAAAVENLFLEAWEMEPFLRTVAWVQGLAAGYGLLQSAGIDFPFPWRESHPDVPVSTFGNPNFAAEWIAAALPITALVGIRAAGGRRFLAGLSLLLGGAFLAVARGRAALLGVAAAGSVVAVLALLAAGGRRRAAGAALGAVLAGAAALAGTRFVEARGELPPVLGRSDTAVVRYELAATTARMLEDHPLGVGPGNWESAFPPYRTEREYRASLRRDPGRAHDDPLQYAAEGGWPLVAAAAAWALLLAGAAWRAVRGEDRGTALALAGSAAAFGAASLFSFPFHRPADLTLFAFAAGGLAFLGGGRETTLGAGGAAAQRLLLVVLAAGSLLLGQAMVAEGPQADGRTILREEAPLPRDRAEAALAAFERAAALDPGAVPALLRAGEVALKLGAGDPDPEAGRRNLERALRHYGAALELRPLDPAVLSAAAECRERLGEPAAAEALWRDALGVAPWHREANAAYGRFLLGAGRAAEALPRLEAALSVDPGHAAALAGRAEALFALDRVAEALEAASTGVDRLLAAVPRDRGGIEEAARRTASVDSLLARMLLGKAVRLLGGADREGGAAVLRGAAFGAPPDLREDFFEEGAQALGAAGRPAEALRFRVNARFAAAEEALAAGDRERAGAEALRATGISLPPSAEGEVRARAAALLARAGRREASLAELGKAVSLGFADAPALERDPAFEGLRSDPAFREVLEQARARAERAGR